MAIKFLDTQVFPPVGAAILISTRPNTIFVDGKPTDQTDGIRCDCRALPDLSPVSVKVPGVQAPISNTEIERRNLAGDFVWVEFVGFVGTQWLDRRTQEIKLSGTATGIKLTNAPAGEEVDF